jgi:hypothetical protein
LAAASSNSSNTAVALNQHSSSILSFIICTNYLAVVPLSARDDGLPYLLLLLQLLHRR